MGLEDFLKMYNSLLPYTQMNTLNVVLFLLNFYWRIFEAELN